MKYFFVWLAILGILTILFPLCLNANFADVREGENSFRTGDEISVYFASDDRVITMNTEDYILGVLMAEMPAEFELEALKAQAVAARTYMAQKANSQGDDTLHKNADVCTDSAHCQAYISSEDAKKNWGKNASLYFKKCKNAVVSTSGVIAVFDNEPIKAVFHSVSGGRTENAEDVWGSDVAYLKSVSSPGEEGAPKYKTTARVNLSEFKKKLTDAYDIDFSEKLIGKSTRSEGGDVLTIEIGNKMVKGSDIRKLFSLSSSDFKISFEDEAAVFDVLGYGHGVGMSQYGANYYAKKGYGYKEILKLYYQGIGFAKL